MAGEYNAGISLEGVLDGGKRSPNSLVTRDLFAVARQRHVEIDPDKDGFATEFQVFYGQFAHMYILECNGSIARILTFR
jgi:hypothetical protein